MVDDRVASNGIFELSENELYVGIDLDKVDTNLASEIWACAVPLTDSLPSKKTATPPPASPTKDTMTKHEYLDATSNGLFGEFFV